jgi:hypothetical protein
LAMPRSCSARHFSGSSLNRLTALLTAATMGSMAAGANVQPSPSPSPAQHQSQITQLSGDATITATLQQDGRQQPAKWTSPPITGVSQLTAGRWQTGCPVTTLHSLD